MPIRLDERLSKIASLIDNGTVADIGCDHGKLSYYLISTEKCSMAIATDISALSLQKTERLALDNGVADILITRVGDGLKPIHSSEVDTIVIAGLGGDVIASILKCARQENKKFKHFVLSPNTHSEKVREEIIKSDHEIVEDDMVFCGKKCYTIIKTSLDGAEILDDMQMLFGKFYKNNETFKEFAKLEIEKKNRIIKQNPKSQNIEQSLDLLLKAIGD